MGIPDIDWTLLGAIASVLQAPIAILALCVALITAYFNAWPVWRQRQVDRTVLKTFGADSYTKEEVLAATVDYVDPECMDVDPTGEADLRQVVSVRSDLFQTVDRFLDGEYNARHLLILADSGMGKTSFLINYYFRNLNKRFRRQRRIALIPLGRPSSLAKIAAIDRKNETVLFLDAFDEDVEAARDYRAELRRVMDASSDFRGVVLTCRTQFFRSDEEVPKETGILKVMSRPAGESGSYRFYKLYIAPFWPKEINAYLRKRFPIWKLRSRNKAMKIVMRLGDLAMRPMLLAIVPDLVNREEQVSTLAQLYDAMVGLWLDRESHWIANAVLGRVSEALAVDIYKNRDVRGMEKIPPTDFERLTSALAPGVAAWRFSTRSLLNRDADGNLKFAHRSIMEFLFVQAYRHGDKRCLEQRWTSDMCMLLGHLTTTEEAFFQYCDDFRATGVFGDNAFTSPGGSEVVRPARYYVDLRAIVRTLDQVCPIVEARYDEPGGAAGTLLFLPFEDLVYLLLWDTSDRTSVEWSVPGLSPTWGGLSSSAIPTESSLRGQLTPWARRSVPTVSLQPHQPGRRTKWRLPSSYEILQLLVAQLRFPGGPLLDTSLYYWTNEQTVDRERVCVGPKAVEGTLSHLSGPFYCSDPPVDGDRWSFEVCGIRSSMIDGFWAVTVWCAEGFGTEYLEWPRFDRSTSLPPLFVCPV